MWPNGEWPRSWPSAIASVRSSFSRSARATLRLIPDTSSVCVSRVRKWSPCGAMNTWVLPFSRRNDLQCTIRSRSRWNGVRSGQISPSACSLPRVSYERTASGDSHSLSIAATRDANSSATGPVRWGIPTS